MTKGPDNISRASQHKLQVDLDNMAVAQHCYELLAINCNQTEKL